MERERKGRREEGGERDGHIRRTTVMEKEV